MTMTNAEILNSNAVDADNEDGYRSYVVFGALESMIPKDHRLQISGYLHELARLSHETEEGFTGSDVLSALAKSLSDSINR